MSSRPQQTKEPPVLTNDEPLGLVWDKPISSIATLGRIELEPQATERHRIYALALMSLLRQNWNGNKRGAIGNYPSRPKQVWRELDKEKFLYRPQPVTDGDGGDPRKLDYLGHNIACLAVDGDGDIIDFDFNHNEVFSSSVEHAESRLIRRIFSLTQLEEGWNLGGNPDASAIASNLSNVTVYTTLEPCAQCAGIMTLAGVKEVVYLQKDFGTFCIGNILYNLTKHDPARPSVSAPRPIAASEIGLRYYDELNSAYEEFFNNASKEPFFLPKPAKPDQTVTSFLCTDRAYALYEDADSKFQKLALELQYPDWSPPVQQPLEDSGVVPETKDNKTVLANAQAFVKRMAKVGRRGTPHKL
jgi:tRNA(Arg) A34 adenosine deaminase TadA